MSQSNTLNQYNEVVESCRDLFIKKMLDYGTSWRILRITSLTDQIFIKANRIRTIEENGKSLVNEGVEAEYQGIINYCVMGLIQFSLGSSMDDKIEANEILALYDAKVDEVRQLMILKNHDYGEAWRSMRIESYTDLILMKILRTKQIELNDGKTIISEGIAANYMDMMNYAIFALIRISENKTV